MRDKAKAYNLKEVREEGLQDPQPSLFYVIYHPSRNKYQGFAQPVRESVPGMPCFRSLEAAQACLDALGKPGAVLRQMTRLEIIVVCKERGVCGSLWFMDDPDNIEVEYF
jgi:hypothetical protein